VLVTTSAAGNVECSGAGTHVADAPGDGALFARGRSLVRLALDTEVHDVVSADGAVVDDNVPGPESYGVPLRHVNFAPCTLPAVSAPTFLTSKRFLSPSALAPALATFVFVGGASAMSTSAMLVRCVETVGCAGS
jgi:hypothetical protein